MNLSTRLTIAMVSLVLLTALAVGQLGLMGAIISALGAGLLAAYITRSLTRPLHSLTQSLEHFTGEEAVDVPAGGAGEIGVLARTFKRMADAVREKTATIRQYAEREKLYIAAVESANDAIFTVDLEGIITTWNPAAERLFGFSAAEAIGKKFSVIATPEQQEEQKKNFERIKHGERLENFETARTRKDGSTIHLSYNSSPVLSADGEIIGASAIARDITERKQADAMFRVAVESSPGAMVMADAAGKIMLVNAETERMFGYARGELIGMPIETLLPKKLRNAHVQHRYSYSADPSRRGMGAGRDLFGVRKDGSEVAVEIGLNSIMTVKGLIVLASIVDTTERKQAEKMFQLAVEASPGAMVMADASGKIVLVNAETERMFGYAQGELIGMPIETLIPKKFRDTHEQHRNSYAAHPSRRMGAGRDLFGVRKDGSELNVEVGLNPIATRNGLVVLAAVVDITERKNHEKVMAERASELQRSNDELEQFAYVASHDLQEPLRMVASYAELLADRYQGKLDDKADKYIAYAVDGAKRMQRLVNDLLMYSRVGTQGHELQPTDADIVAGHVLRALKGKIDESGAKVEVGSLPVVNADEGQLGQLLQNLIGNALKFHAGRPLQVRVGAEPSRQGWTFFVEDNGIGIEPQYTERVFQMFQRLHDREAYEGSGIGLTIAKKIVERHGGRIWFESEPGKGTTFFFTLPATQEKAA